MVFNDGPPIAIASKTINESSILPPHCQRYFLPLTCDPIGHFVVDHLSRKISNVDWFGRDVLSTSVFCWPKEGWNSMSLSVRLRNWFQVLWNRFLLICKHGPFSKSSRVKTLFSYVIRLICWVDKLSGAIKNFCLPLSLLVLAKNISC